jgi:hypothetical protein
MQRWRDLGITSTHEDVEGVYINAIVDATGRTRDEIFDEYLDATQRLD